ncbi:hypothetical protein BROUX41_000847 [Berkeleyomyces rouxiae]|uniref:uncharacterized protein n=1 Tax=Berkeleyomyces rouxiae TaxID=2035830 RepID=UPI003B829262
MEDLQLELYRTLSILDIPPGAPDMPVDEKNKVCNRIRALDNSLKMLRAQHRVLFADLKASRLPPLPRPPQHRMTVARLRMQQRNKRETPRKVVPGPRPPPIPFRI